MRKCVKPLESVAAAIRHQLLLKNQQDLEATWKREARAAFKAELFPEVWQKVPSPLQPSAPAQPPAVP